MLSTVLLVVMFCALTSSGSEINASDWETGSHEYIVAKYFQKRQYMRTSNIGAILLKNEFVNISPRRKRFVVYIHTSNVSRLHQHDKRPEDRQNPLEGCSVFNCEFVEEDSWLPEVEAVLVTLGEGDPPDADARAARTDRQRWVFLSLTSPMYTIDKDQIKQLGNLFDWSMTYRTDSDVPVPFGRTLPLAAPATANRSLTEVAALVPNWERKQHEVLAAALLSNCRPKTRMNYLNTLKMHMRVHYYGSCFYRKPNEQCPKIGDCHSIKRYIFYLAFENSECNEYMSERVWSHALRNGAIPVVQGAARDQCAALLPPGSFLHVADYATPRDLALHMRDIATSHEKILRHHVWRRHFEAREEATAWAGVADSRLCRLCEALNYNARRRRLYSQDDLRRFLDPTINCRNIP